MGWFKPKKPSHATVPLMDDTLCIPTPLSSSTSDPDRKKCPFPIKKLVMSLHKALRSYFLNRQNYPTELAKSYKMNCRRQEQSCQVNLIVQSHTSNS